MENSDTIIEDAKRIIANGESETAIALLIEAVSPIDEKIRDELFLLKERLARVKFDFNKNLITYDIYSIEISRINDAVMHICNQIPTTEEIKKQSKKKSNGKLLYDIPDLMPLNLETKCIVRIAHESINIWNKIINRKSVNTEDISVSSIMEVILLDMSLNKGFEIRPFVSSEQFIEPDEYTEWIFLVKAIVPGHHILYLKVSAIQIIDNIQRRKEIIVEKTINVVTPSETKEVVRSWQDSNIILATKKSKYVGFVGVLRQNILTIVFVLISLAGLVASIGAFIFSKTNKKDVLMPVPIDTNYQKITAGTAIISSDTILTKSVFPKTNKIKSVQKKSEKILLPIQEGFKKDTALQTQTPISNNKENISPNKPNFYKLLMSITDNLQNKDTVNIGRMILITLKTTGIKSKHLVVLNEKGGIVKPTASDENVYYFDLKAIQGTFRLRVMDTDTKIYKDRIFDGNTNCIWTVKQMAANGKVGID